MSKLQVQCVGCKAPIEIELGGVQLMHMECASIVGISHSGQVVCSNCQMVQACTSWCARFSDGAGSGTNAGAEAGNYTG